LVLARFERKLTGVTVPSLTFNMEHDWRVMAQLRPEELWAKACIEQSLPGVIVQQHDDGSEDGMYDLTIVYPDGSIAAAEVTTAGDEDYIKLAKALDKKAKGWQVPGLTGTWWVRALPSARAQDLRKQLPDILGGLESSGIRRIRGDQSSPHALAAMLGKLGVSDATQAVTDQNGKVLVTAEKSSQFMGSLLPATGDPLAVWLGEWLAEPSQNDNAWKLGRSDAAEKHLFVLVPSFTPPSVVSVLLAEASPPLPTIPPDLPSGITHVWVMSMWIDWGNGLRWSPDGGWSRFEKVKPVVGIHKP